MPAQFRRAGLSSKAPVKPLLSFVGGQERSSAPVASKPKESRPQTPTPEDVNAPPIDSSSEASDGEKAAGESSKNAVKAGYDSSDDEISRSTAANIRPTSFVKSAPQAKRGYGQKTTKKPYGRSGAPVGLVSRPRGPDRPAAAKSSRNRSSSLSSLSSMEEARTEKAAKSNPKSSASNPGKRKRGPEATKTERKKSSVRDGSQVRGVTDEPKAPEPEQVRSLPSFLLELDADGEFEKVPPLTSPNHTSLAQVTEISSDVESVTDHDLSCRKADSVCPLCDLPVDGDLLKAFSKGGYLTIRQQMRFCNLHKKQDARQLWQEKGYPTIDWDRLNKRCTRHHDHLERVIRGKSGKNRKQDTAFFRNAFADRIATGEERTLRRTERSLAPGYYGKRGLRAFSEHIIRNFNTLLRERAVDDYVISSRGTATFVAMVLVPELATRLIMDDMKVGAEEARQILEESVSVGDLLHEEVDDVVGDIECDVAVTVG